MHRFTISLLAVLACIVAPAHAQTWCYTGSLHTARRMFSMTLLHDGRVLVAGGIIGNDAITNTCEVLDITQPALEQYMATQDGLAATVTGASAAGNNTFTVVDNMSATPVAQFTTQGTGRVTIDIVTSDGRPVATLARETYPQGSYRLPIGTAGLPAGVYFVRMESASYHGVQRFVVAC